MSLSRVIFFSGAYAQLGVRMNEVLFCTTPYQIRDALLNNLVIAIRAGG